MLRSFLAKRTPQTLVELQLQDTIALSLPLFAPAILLQGVVAALVLGTRHPEFLWRMGMLASMAAAALLAAWLARKGRVLAGVEMFALAWAAVMLIVSPQLRTLNAAAPLVFAIPLSMIALVASRRRMLLALLCTAGLFLTFERMQARGWIARQPAPFAMVASGTLLVGAVLMLLLRRFRGDIERVFAERLRQEAETAGLRTSLRLSEAMSAMGALVAGVAHEVRNPLFGMTATLDAMEARFPDCGPEAHLRALRSELERLNQLMHDLLEYGKPPGAEIARGPLRAVVESAVRDCAREAESRSVTIENAVGEALALQMDAARLEQVFQNLIENAVQHTPPRGQVRVEASLSGAAVEVRVLDSGLGFHPDDLRRAFEPFFTRRQGGTGLGLSIVQRIVEQHGGVTEARNRSGGGGMVLVRLPRGQDLPLDT